MSDILPTNNEHFQSAQTMLSARLRWETKQRAYYTMRHDGLPRLNKPFPSCADSHYPSIDLAIRRLKPFWMGQITAGDKLCVFTALKQQLDALNDAAGNYFDFVLNQRTPFLRKMRHMLDTMLLTGRGIIKATIDPLNGYAVVFESINPMFFLMPQEGTDPDTADGFVHVRQFTVDSYKRLDQRWDTSDKTLQQIRGQAPGNLNVYIQQKRLQEGINYSTQVSQVIIWEHWVKSRSGWTIYTYSPLAPDIALRQPYGNPYKLDNKASCPFFGFQMEVTDEGWYAPRGLGELLAPVEQYMTKLWNDKADMITFVGKPLYTGDKEIVNSSNYRWQPGEYIPGNIKSVQQSPVPVQFDQELAFAQGIAEQQSQSPDFGITSQGDSQNTGGKPRTATENQRIAALQQAGGNDNAMMFREDLTKLYRHVWAMICQFKERDFAYYAAGEIGTLPEQALHDQYIITPDGSPEGWNRLQRFQKAIGAMQTFDKNPNVDPEVLTKDALNAYDGRMALKAFIPTNLKGASEYEDEALIISSLIVPGSGKPAFPATVKPNEDQPSRIKAIIDWMHAAGVKGTPIDQQSKTVLHQRLVQRLQILKQQNPQAAKQIEQSLKNMEQAGQGGQPSGNGAPTGPSASTPTQNGNGAPPPMKPVSEAININYKDLSLPVQNEVLTKIGLAPNQQPALPASPP